MKSIPKLLKKFTILRDSTIWALSLGRDPRASDGWIKFPMYHQIKSDQVSNFERQLDYMGRIGTFISLDDAVGYLQSGDVIEGRYFCLTFDDGYKSAITDAYPVLAEREIPATFFVVPKYINCEITLPGPSVEGNQNKFSRYLTWDDCRRLSAGGMTIGSHSLSHRNFAGLTDTEARHELLSSKEIIAEQIGGECNHFACPWGQPYDSYIPERDPDFTKKAGYRSFMSTTRGSARRGHKSIVLPRDRVEPGWELYRLKYFFSRHDN
jgi:peptidoglycan/xylan/chitin deacetylase (PgdA/CDA1 family)